MSATHLVACPSCARHVRASEATCSFCTTALPAALRDSIPRPGPVVRLSRAALVAFGAGGLVAPTGACSSAYGAAIILDADSVQPYDAGDGALPDVRAVNPPYGIAPPFDAGQDVNVAVPYGVPVPPDAAPADAHTDAVDGYVGDGKAD